MKDSGVETTVGCILWTLRCLRRHVALQAQDSQDQVSPGPILPAHPIMSSSVFSPHAKQHSALVFTEAAIRSETCDDSDAT